MQNSNTKNEVTPCNFCPFPKCELKNESAKSKEICCPLYKGFLKFAEQMNAAKLKEEAATYEMKALNPSATPCDNCPKRGGCSKLNWADDTKTVCCSIYRNGIKTINQPQGWEKMNVMPLPYYAN